MARDEHKAREAARTHRGEATSSQQDKQQVGQKKQNGDHDLLLPPWRFRIGLWACRHGQLGRKLEQDVEEAPPS